MEIFLVFIINQAVMEDSLTFMAKESKYLYFFSYCSWITLEDTCFKKRKEEKFDICGTYSISFMTYKILKSNLIPKLPEMGSLPVDIHM